MSTPSTQQRAAPQGRAALPGDRADSGAEGARGADRTPPADSPETVQDLVSSGLIRIGNPRRYGGHGVEMDAAFDVAWELGRGCGSTGWCYAPVDGSQLVARRTSPSKPRRNSSPAGRIRSSRAASTRPAGRPSPWMAVSGLRPLGLFQRLRRGELGHGGHRRPRPRQKCAGCCSARELRDRRHVVRRGDARNGQQGHRRQAMPSCPPTAAWIRTAPATASGSGGRSTSVSAIACRLDA